MDTNYKSIPLTRTVIASLLGGCKFVERKNNYFIYKTTLRTIYNFCIKFKHKLYWFES